LLSLLNRKKREEEEEEEGHESDRRGERIKADDDDKQFVKREIDFAPCSARNCDANDEDAASSDRSDRRTKCNQTTESRSKTNEFSHNKRSDVCSSRLDMISELDARFRKAEGAVAKIAAEGSDKAKDKARMVGTGEATSGRARQVKGDTRTRVELM
jgi:hypothetical protein